MQYSLCISIVKVALAYVIVAAIEIPLHSYLAGAHGATADYFRGVFFARQGDKVVVGGLIDTILPGIILGVTLGTQAWRMKWRRRYVLLPAAILTVGIIVLIPFYSALFRMAAPRWLPETSHLYPGTVGSYLMQFVIVFALCTVPAFIMTSVEVRHAHRSKYRPGEKRPNTSTRGGSSASAHLPTILRVASGNLDKLFEMLTAKGLDVARWQIEGQVNTRVKTVLVCWLAGDDRYRYSIAIQEFPSLLSDELLVVVALSAFPDGGPHDSTLLGQILAILKEWGAQLVSL